MNKFLFSIMLAAVASIAAVADTLSGRVTEADGKPVEFATVTAMQADADKGGAVTDSLGYYKIELPKGEYKVNFSLVGYTEKNATVNVDGATTLNTTLEANAVALKGVEVKASAIRRLPDRFVVRVEDMPSAIGKDGKDLLKTAPGVWIDDKNISINGKSGVKVYVNDRELRLDHDQLIAYLQSLKAEDISRVEVIPQTGAEYSADSSAGIIKIVLKRNRTDGVMGSVSVSSDNSSTQSNIAPSMSLNIKDGKWSYNILGNFNTYFRNESNSEQRTDYDSGITYASNSHIDMKKSLSGYGQAGIFFDPDSKNSLALELSYSQDRDPSATSTNSTMGNDAAMRTMAGLYVNHSHSLYFDGTFNYVHRLDSIGSMMKVIANFNRSRERRLTDNSLHEVLGSLATDSLSNSHESSIYDVVTLSYDFDKIFNQKWSMAAGAKYTLNRMDNDASYRYLKDGSWVTPEGRGYDEVYKENICGVYAKASGKFGKFLTTVGLRGEYTNTHSRGGIVSQNYFDLFPNANLTWMMNASGSNTLTAQYSRSITRPSFWALNPIGHQTSDVFYQTGNPHLKPSYSNTFSLTATLLYQYSLNLFASVNKDGIMQGTMADETNPNNVVFTSVNADNAYMYGASLYLPVHIKDWWTLTGNVSYMIDGERLTANGDLNYHNFWNFYLQSGFELPKDFYFEISYFGMTNVAFGEVRLKGQHYLNASIKKTFCKKRWTVSFDANNILSQKLNFQLISAAGYVNTNVYKNPVSFRLSVRYNFNIGKVFQARNIDKNTDDSRIGKTSIGSI